VPCPHCETIGTLNRHSRLFGNDPATAQARLQRGQRVYCSNRGNRQGCGRSSSVFLANTLPRYTFDASLLWRLLSHWLGSGSIQATTEELQQPFGLDTIYSLFRGLRRSIQRWRAKLSSLSDPPASLQTDPLGQTIEHFQTAFVGRENPLQEFQIRFQLPLMG